jgi:hypothetical protein
VQQLDTFTLLRYGAMALCGAIALRSLYRLGQRGLRTELFMTMCQKLANAGQFSRLAKLATAGGERTAALLLTRALSLRLPTATAPTGEQGHFRDAGEQGAPFEARWKQAMDAAQSALKLEVMTDLGAAIGGSAFTLLLAALGTYVATDRAAFSRNAAAAAVAMMAMFGAANMGRTALSGLVIVRRFCETLRTPVEQMDDERLAAAKIAEGWWRSRAAAQGVGTDV